MPRTQVQCIGIVIDGQVMVDRRRRTLVPARVMVKVPVVKVAVMINGVRIRTRFQVKMRTRRVVCWRRRLSVRVGKGIPKRQERDQ